MVAIILLIAAAFALSVIFNRKIYETLAVAVFSVTLIVYAFALILPLTVAVYICMGLVSATLLYSLWKFRGHFRKELPKSYSSQEFDGHLQKDLPDSYSSSEFDGHLRKDLRESAVIARITDFRTLLCFITLICACTLFCILLAGRHVFYYDDLSYWALYTKNIFSIDALPHLYENCSVDYKDYTPIIQIMQYIAMFGRKAFSETVMFAANVCFIYIMLLPLLYTNGSARHQSDLNRGGSDMAPLPSKKNTALRNIVTVILYLIFPHILTAQFYYRLGVDLLLALVFGYILYCIFMEEKYDAFTIFALITGLSFLALIKTSGIVLCLLAIAIFAAREISRPRGRAAGGEMIPVSAAQDTDRRRGNDARAEMNNSSSAGSSKFPASIRIAGRIGLLLVFAVGSYLTWQLFLHYSWNNGYLSNRVKAGVSGGGFTFPEYTGEVVLNYIKHFFTYPLTRNGIGATAFLLVVFIVAVHVAVRRSASADKLLHVMLVSTTIGLAVFMIAHLSMYLFVFDEWEAHGLMEFDRYITQYLGGLFFVYMCLLIKKDANRILLYISAAVFIILLPYGDMKTYLIPHNYEAMYQKEYAGLAENARNEWARSGIDDLKLAHDGTAKLTVVADAWDETTQFIEYTAVPQPINRIVNVPGSEPGRICGYIMDFVDEYVYVCENAPASYTGDWNETKTITSDGEALRPGTLYKVIRSGDSKTLESM